MILIAGFFVIELGVLINFAPKIAAFETMVGLLAAYGILEIAALSDYFSAVVYSKYRRFYRKTKKYSILNGWIKLGISAVVLVLVMLFLALAEFPAALLSSALGVTITIAEATAVQNEIYGALIGGWFFYLIFSASKR